jgi:hypothetical protein
VFEKLDRIENCKISNLYYQFINITLGGGFMPRIDYGICQADINRIKTAMSNREAMNVLNAMNTIIGTCFEARNLTQQQRTNIQTFLEGTVKRLESTRMNRQIWDAGEVIPAGNIVDIGMMPPDDIGQQRGHRR